MGRKRKIHRQRRPVRESPPGWLEAWGSMAQGLRPKEVSRHFVETIAWTWLIGGDPTKRDLVIAATRAGFPPAELPLRGYLSTLEKPPTQELWDICRELINREHASYSFRRKNIDRIAFYRMVKAMVERLRTERPWMPVYHDEAAEGLSISDMVGQAVKLSWGRVEAIYRKTDAAIAAGLEADLICGREIQSEKDDLS
jgi:hypothetical protein